MVKSNGIPGVFNVILLLAWSAAGLAMAPRPAPPPVPMELVRAAYDPEAGAISIEWIVPNVEAVGPLDRLELLILNAKGKAVLGALQNLSDRCDPIPPGAFGAVLDPACDDRSIKNVASAGQNGQWDQEAPHGTLLQQSVSGIHAGTLGIAFWIVPKNWKPGTYLIAVRAARKKSAPEPWRNLATCDVPGNGTGAANRGNVRFLFKDADGKDFGAADWIHTLTLLRCEQQPQDEGVVMKRWAGDTSGETKTVVIEERKLKLSDFPDGLIPLEPGLYQFKHNSVSGNPPTGFYGESPVFEVRPESETVEVQVQLYPAI
ncbi:MAG: hypothetical protein AB7V14_01605 [Kiritimatiellia bacterium]